MIASIGPGLPQDLFAATGRYRGPLGWNVDRDIPAADRWLESKFPPWARSIAADWAEGAFDDLELVVFSRADDAAQRLYYYLCELQRDGTVRGPEPFLLDIAKVTRSSSLDHSIAWVRKLAARLALDDAALEAGIAATNATRDATPLPAGGRVCLLDGTPPPDDRLHDAISDAGFVPLGPTLAGLWRDPGPRVDTGSGDPAAAIGRQLHARPDAQRGFGNAAVAAAERARAAKAQAAVLWYTEEDEARVWDVPAVRAALADLGIPTCVLTRRDWTARDGATDAIRTFLKELPA